MEPPSSDHLFQLAFTHAAIGMALVAPDGSWLQVNRSLCGILGYSPEELRGHRFQELTHPEDLQLDLEKVSQLLAGEIESYRMEKRYRHKDGHFVWGLLSVSLVREPQTGAALYFISQIQDISAAKVAEQALGEALLEKERLMMEAQTAGRAVQSLRDQLLTVCAWTKRIRYNDQWISTDEFLRVHFKLNVTHGISEEAMEKILAEEKPRAPRVSEGR